MAEVDRIALRVQEIESREAALRELEAAEILSLKIQEMYAAAAIAQAWSTRPAVDRDCGCMLASHASGRLIPVLSFASQKTNNCCRRKRHLEQDRDSSRSIRMTIEQRQRRKGSGETRGRRKEGGRQQQTKKRRKRRIDRCEEKG